MKQPHKLFVWIKPSETPIAITVVYENHNPWGQAMKSSVIKHSIMINGHKTSVSLEDAFWRALKEIARGQQATLSNVVAEIDKARKRGNLSSAIRLFVLNQVRGSATTGPAMLSSLETETSTDGLLQPQI